jgi:acetoacetyl-CoA synthetase
MIGVLRPLTSLLTVEPTPDLEGPAFRKLTYAELYAHVANAVSALTEQGVTKGDRVASYSSNCIVRFVGMHRVHHTH